MLPLGGFMRTIQATTSIIDSQCYPLLSLQCKGPKIQGTWAYILGSTKVAVVAVRLLTTWRSGVRFTVERNRARSVSGLWYLLRGCIPKPEARTSPKPDGPSSGFRVPQNPKP